MEAQALAIVIMVVAVIANKAVSNDSTYVGTLANLLTASAFVGAGLWLFKPVLF